MQYLKWGRAGHFEYVKNKGDHCHAWQESEKAYIQTGELLLCLNDPRFILLSTKPWVYLREPPPVSHLCLQAQHFCRQPVDLLLRPNDVAKVHFIAVETLVGPRGPGHEGGHGGGHGRGGSGDGQQSGAGGDRLSRLLQVLDLLLESILPSFQVIDLHLGRRE